MNGINEAALESNQKRLQDVLGMLVKDTRDFVGQTLAAHPKGQVYIDRLPATTGSISRMSPPCPRPAIPAPTLPS